MKETIFYFNVWKGKMNKECVKVSKTEKFMTYKITKIINIICINSFYQNQKKSFEGN